MELQFAALPHFGLQKLSFKSKRSKTVANSWSAAPANVASTLSLPR